MAPAAVVGAHDRDDVFGRAGLSAETGRKNLKYIDARASWKDSSFSTVNDRRMRHAASEKMCATEICVQPRCLCVI